MKDVRRGVLTTIVGMDIHRPPLLPKWPCLKRGLQLGWQFTCNGVASPATTPSNHTGNCLFVLVSLSSLPARGHQKRHRHRGAQREEEGARVAGRWGNDIRDGTRVTRELGDALMWSTGGGGGNAAGTWKVKVKRMQDAGIRTAATWLRVTRGA